MPSEVSFLAAATEGGGVVISGPLGEEEEKMDRFLTDGVKNVCASERAFALEAASLAA